MMILKASMMTFHMRLLLKKGIFIISLKDRTKKELQTKLNEKYFNTKMVQKAVQKLEELGYINDLDYTISYINNRKYGKNRISYNLFQKGINRETIDKAYNIIEEEMEKILKIENWKRQY